jgi:hypothetical protein
MQWGENCYLWAGRRPASIHRPKGRAGAESLNTGKNRKSTRGSPLPSISSIDTITVVERQHCPFSTRSPSPPFATRPHVPVPGPTLSDREGSHAVVIIIRAMKARRIVNISIAITYPWRYVCSKSYGSRKKMDLLLIFQWSIGRYVVHHI